MSGTPERIKADPRVALVAFRWPSSKVEGVFYDVALLTGEPQPGAFCGLCEGADPWSGDLPNGGCVCRPGRPYWTCSCAGFSYRDQCRHVIEAIRELANEGRREERQAKLNARIGCRHLLTVDEEEWDESAVWRRCVGCGLIHDVLPRTVTLIEDIRARRRAPPSPWTAAERSEDPG